MPVEYGPWGRIYDLFRRWQRDGTWQRILTRRQFAEPGDHGLGRSRGGFTTKLHLAVEQGQQPMAIVVTAGHRASARSNYRERYAVECGINRPKRHRAVATHYDCEDDRVLPGARV